jgi:mono/diheme cytochrome c family protein
MARLSSALAAFAIVAAGVSAAPTASGQETVETFLGGSDGGALFKTYCAVCHGKTAKGDGPLADDLRVRPPDLTLLAKRNKGTFDADQVHRIIDGREPIKGHGGPDMPVWGDAFKRSREGFSEKAVKARIDAIVDHLESVQAK